MNAVSNSVGARQLARFVTIGIISNALLFVLYLLMTELGMGYNLAATLAYMIGVSQTFVFNRGWTFRDRGAVWPTFARYVAIYAFGYLCNMVALFVLVDRAGFPHQWVQGVTILVLAVMLFLVQKFWVFRGKARASQ